MTRISSLDEGYISGDLSFYPDALDDKDNLYEVSNNATTILKQTLSFNGKNIIVNDASKFPPRGLLKLNSKNKMGDYEIIYYGKRTNSVFSELLRGFAGSRQFMWSSESTVVSNSVMAEHHNAIKDAIIKIQRHLGLKENPSEDSINGMLKKIESIHLAPKPLFRSYPLKGPPLTKIKFKNLTSNNAIRFFWDFGDGTNSIEKNPTHVYTREGIYTVKLNVITNTGAQGISVKKNYIKISEREQKPFFYISKDKENNNKYHFVDQTDGSITSRSWIFDDGTTETQTDPDIHTTSHVYQNPGVYRPTLIIVFADQSFKRVFLSEEINIE